MGRLFVSKEMQKMFAKSSLENHRAKMQFMVKIKEKLEGIKSFFNIIFFR